MLSKISFIGTLFAATALTSLAQSEANLIFNSGFELGSSGFDLHRFQRIETNPEYVFEPLAFDRDQFVSGTQSAKISNPYSEQVNLIIREVLLKKDSTYTFSFYAKSSRDGYPVRIRILSFSPSQGKWISDVRREMSIADEWSRYQATFKTSATQAEEEYHTFYIETCREPGAVGADLWFDDMQVERAGEATPWKSRSGLEVAVKFVSAVGTASPDEVEAMRQLLLLEDDKPEVYTLRVEASNTMNEPLVGEVVVDVVDDYYGQVVDQIAVPIELAANATGTFEYQLEANQYGTFRFEANASGALADSFSSFGDSFVVAGLYEAEPVNMDEVFYVGVNTGLSPLRADKKSRGGRYVAKNSYWAKGISVPGYLNLLAKMGCRIIRDWDGEADTGFDWDILEPVEGEFNFDSSDVALALAEQHGFAFIPVLGGGIGTTHRATLPGWVVERSVVRTVTPYNNRPQTLPYLPPVESWRKYVRAVAERYAGRITHYEIMNEPNPDFFPEEYFVYLKAAYEEIKAADPSAKVIGFCSSGDWGLPLGDFIVSGAKLGGLDYVDIASYHPYETPNMASPKMSASDMNRSTIDVIRSFESGRDVPLWNTELYFLTNYAKGGFKRYQYEPYEAAHRQLTDQGDGLGQSVAINGGTIWSSDISSHLDGQYGRRWLPTAKFAAYNAMARHFEGAKPLLKLPVEDDIAFYLFNRGDKHLAAVWSYGEAKDFVANLPAQIANVTVLDLFGNVIPSEGGQVAFDETIRYLVWDNIDEDTLLAEIEHATFEKR